MKTKRRQHQKYLAVAVILLLIVGQLGPSGFARANNVARYAPGSIYGSQLLERSLAGDDLEAFTDALIPPQLSDYQIAGAMVSIVQDGEIVLAKGYGFANVEEHVPASPHESLFRIGSTSKLFTWTAVMQLVEQGKIDLYTDINTYLPDFQIPANYPEPITLWHLLTHTAGFEERFNGMLAHSPEDMISLQDYVASYMPARVRPPGEMTAYSNYGAALAGYIVESTTGIPFEQYIETYVFEPLEMTHSTFRQPVPANLQPNQANAYINTDSLQPLPFEYIAAAPMGSMSTTAVDMAHFMLAHLQNGEFEGRRILTSETARQMHTRQFANDQRLSGFTLGFFDGEQNGKRFIEHGGAFTGWFALLVLLPEQNTGLFVVYNARSGETPAREFFQSFMNLYFPENDPKALPAPANSTGRLEDFEGYYQCTRSVSRHLDRIAHYAGSAYLRVSIVEDGSLATKFSMGGEPVRESFFQTQDPLVFRSLDGDNTLIFHTGADGRVDHLLFEDRPHYAFERVNWTETPMFASFVLAACLVILLATLLIGMVTAVGGTFRKKGASFNITARAARVWVWCHSAAYLGLMGGILYYQRDLLYLIPAYLGVVVRLTQIVSVLVIGPSIFTILAWTRRYWSLPGRVHFTIATFALLGMVWSMNYFRLLDIYINHVYRIVFWWA